jgi:hypothetical protein
MLKIIMAIVTVLLNASSLPVEELPLCFSVPSALFALDRNR